MSIIADIIKAFEKRSITYVKIVMFKVKFSKRARAFVNLSGLVIQEL